MDFYEEAKKKLKEALPGIKGPKEGAIKQAAMEALLNFAGQEPEFAQAIVQGGDFADCMKAVCKGIGTSISDLEVYGRAAAFYFPGSKVRFEMHIDLEGGPSQSPPLAAATAPPEGGPRGSAGGKESGRSGLIFDLADFL